MNIWTSFYRKLFCRKGYGVHSPFMFNLITKVISERWGYYSYKDLSVVRLQLAQSQELITDSEQSLPVSKILRQQCITAREGQLLFRLANYFHPHSILTFGSSLGLTPLYLTAFASKNIHCVALEREEATATFVRPIVEKYSPLAIKVRDGAYCDTLNEAFKDLTPIDCIVFDNVTDEEKLPLFEQCLSSLRTSAFVMIRGIANTPVAQTTWATICAHPSVTASIDLYTWGLVFFNPKLHRQTFKSIV